MKLSDIMRLEEKAENIVSTYFGYNQFEAEESFVIAFESNH